MTDSSQKSRFLEPQKCIAFLMKLRQMKSMKPIKIFFDKVGNTLNVWFDDPAKEAISEETVLIKDKKSKVTGFEVLNYLSSSELKDLKKLPVETEILA